MRGYEALRQGAAWTDLTGRAVFRLTGKDRTRWLHAMTTNHIAQLEPGQGCYAFLLDARGHILADANILCLPDSFWLDLEPELRQPILAHLHKHIIADDVTLEDLTGRTMVIGVEGPQSGDVVRELGLPAPEAPFAHAQASQLVVARLSATGLPGLRIFGDRAQREVLLDRLAQVGVPEADDEALRTVRLEQGRPRYGEDITSQRLPQETQLLHAIHFSKGCYIGQEIVERIRSRGQVHRLLMRLAIEGDDPPPAGSPVSSGEHQIGEITSAAFSPALGHVVALGILRTAEIRPATGLRVAGGTARLINQPPA